MAVKKKIASEKLVAIQKKLRQLPVKETGKTREEALEFLRQGVQAALRKGYSLAEVRDILRSEGVTLALSSLVSEDGGQVVDASTSISSEELEEPKSSSESTPS